MSFSDGECLDSGFLFDANLVRSSTNYQGILKHVVAGCESDICSQGGANLYYS